MSAMVSLSDYRKAEVAEQIDEIVQRKNIDALDSATDEVLRECARRYVFAQIKLRRRNDSRARERFAKARDKANETLRAKARMIVDEFARDLHEEWTASLLADQFSLPDGTRVTWADATISDHEKRARQLESLAAGDLLTASIHRNAIRDIEAANVRTLAEVVA